MAPPMPTPEALKVLPKAALAGLVCEAAATGDVEGARALIKAGVSMDVGTAYDQRTPLHLAAASGNLRMVKFLIEECQVTLRRDRFGLMPINDAVENGHTEVRRYLQSIKLEWAKEKAELKRVTGRARSDSIESLPEVSSKESTEELMGTVFELVVKEGVFSYTTVYQEVSRFFKGLGLHPMYFEHFTAMQIAKHIHCLVAAKRVAQATNDMDRMDFALVTEASGVFLTTVACPVPTEAQRRTEEKVARHLDEIWAKRTNFSLKFMASEGTLEKSSTDKLGIFATEQGHWSGARINEDETHLQVLASSQFLKEKTKPAQEQYQIVLEDVVTKGRPCVRCVPGHVYPGPIPGGFVLLFGTPETNGRTYFTEVCQALRFAHLLPRRFYIESFANGVITYTLFFPSAKEDEVHALGRAVTYSTHLKSNGTIYHSVMQATISHEVGLYLSAAVKFAYAFFPKEQYAREYMDVHQVLETNPAAQRKLESLYKLCMKDLLSHDRILDLITRNLGLMKQIFDNFRDIAMGKCEPHFSEPLANGIDAACPDLQDRQILKMLLMFNESILLTNFFKRETPGAFAFRLNPAVVLKGRPTSLYPDIPYGIYLVSGRGFRGFHVRFRDVARGGIRVVRSRDSAAFSMNVATVFDEAYNLAFTQQLKNKDIPEGGSKGVILPDFLNDTKAEASQSPEYLRSCFVKYINALLDCMLPEQQGIFDGHMQGRKEILFFGPDENTANVMDLGAELGKARGYPYWKALTTGKSVRLGGVPHDTYGMTTASVHTYVVELLKKLGEDEASITKFQTGGPDGDLGSNEILVSKDRTVGIVDGSGVLYDPAGLNREELKRLATLRAPVKNFTDTLLGKGGFKVLVEDMDVVLPDGSKYATGAELRDTFHLTSYAQADLFVPCGGRPNAVTTGNVKSLFNADGRPKFRMIVEGANLFLSDGAREILEKAGVHVFKDASTNKGGVCSSSMEVLAALALPDEMHTQLMTYNPMETSEPPAFYTAYVRQILDVIKGNAYNEFHAIWECNQQDKVPKVECTRRLSVKINQMCDNIQQQFNGAMSEEEQDRLVRSVLKRAVPPILLEKLGVDGILRRVPQNYVAALVGAWVASHFVYKNGINASEVAFFFFMKALVSDEEEPSAKKPRVA